MAGASSDWVWMRCGDWALSGGVGAGVFALTVSNSDGRTCRGAFGCCRAFLGGVFGFWTP